MSTSRLKCYKVILFEILKKAEQKEKTNNILFGRFGKLERFLGQASLSIE